VRSWRATTSRRCATAVKIAVNGRIDSLALKTLATPRGGEAMARLPEGSRRRWNPSIRVKSPAFAVSHCFNSLLSEGATCALLLLAPKRATAQGAAFSSSAEAGAFSVMALVQRLASISLKVFCVPRASTG
jgi:hypothetical protein